MALIESFVVSYRRFAIRNVFIELFSNVSSFTVKCFACNLGCVQYL